MHARREQRVQAELNVNLEQGKGVTRDVSESGVYFETDLPFTPGAPISFSFNFDDAPGGPLVLKCEARIVRVEDRGGKTGVGATITSYKFECLDSSVREPA